MRAGESLRLFRSRAGLTTREVAEFSQRIAQREGNDELSISHARMIQIENDASTPSVHKLFSLSIIYGVAFNEMVSLYVDLTSVVKHGLDLGLSNTRLASPAIPQEAQRVRFPVRFDPAFKADDTNLLSRMVQEWGEVPVGWLPRLNVRNVKYGFIGLRDYTMSPLLRPGSFVQIEEQKAPTESAEPVGYRSEFDRPIWFLELRAGYVCSWCEFRRDKILSVPHPLSRCRTREFAARDVFVVGRVTAVAARLVNNADAARSATPPTQS
jgi:transcriptional regulator with XRE-family HTH domain